MGVYRPITISGKTAYLSGHGPIRADGSLIVGRVGAELDEQAAYDAARQTGLTMLATLRSALGNLDRVRKVVKILGVVNCTPEFVRHPAAINGCSELFARVFGDQIGVGARSAVGACSLPENMPVEIEGIFEIE